MNPAPAPVSLEALRAQWEAAWPAALAAWSRFTRLRPPRLCLSTDEAKGEGLTGSFAMIRLADQAVVVSLPAVMASGVEPYAVEVLAHEIGHHVLAPATLTDHARTLARMRHALPTIEHEAPMVANLYTDLMINDRLQRGAGLRIADVYRAIARTGSAGGAVWALYVRIYEILWGIERGSLGGGPVNDALEGDAILGSRLVRSFAHDWLDGAGRFAALLLPHLLKDERSRANISRLLDTRHAGQGGDPAGLVEMDENEINGAIHPSEDPELTGEGGEEGREGTEAEGAVPREVDRNLSSRGQAREPFQYGEILRASGLAIDDHEASVRYYRERARPNLIPFPTRPRPESTDPLPEGLEPWEIGDAPDAADWIQSVLQSPHVVPGVTTVQRVWGTSEGAEPEREPIDLDLYVDCSGSMPNPQQRVSFLTLAGAILALSALRAGARVQATLWSGAHEVQMTPGFVREEAAILRVLTGYFGGGTAFPIHVLRETYAQRTRRDRAVHLLVISDDGVTTMFDRDEKGNSGWDVARTALANARAGGTLVLNIPEQWETHVRQGTEMQRLKRARDELGWDINVVATWPDLVAFAREFSRRKFGGATEPATSVMRS